MGFGFQTGSGSRFVTHLLANKNQAGNLNIPSLSSFICKMGIILL